jgi:hypothetical protein
MHFGRPACIAGSGLRLEIGSAITHTSPMVRSFLPAGAVMLADD